MNNSSNAAIELISSDSAKIIANAVSEVIDQNQTTKWYEAFESVLVGIGTLLIGVGALYTIAPWVDKRREELKKKRKIDKYKSIYPLTSIDSDYSIVVSKTDRGKWYLIDKRFNTRHWIEDMDTVMALGWRQSKKEITESTLKKFKNKKSITILR
jgi:hypothetical protein